MSVPPSQPGSWYAEERNLMEWTVESEMLLLWHKMGEWDHKTTNEEMRQELQKSLQMAFDRGREHQRKELRRELIGSP